MYFVVNVIFITCDECICFYFLVISFIIPSRIVVLRVFLCSSIVSNVLDEIRSVTRWLSTDLSIGLSIY